MKETNASSEAKTKDITNKGAAKAKADAEAQRLYDYTIKHHEENILQDKVIPTEIKPR